MRDNYKTILQNRLDSFNNIHRLKIEYTDLGAKNKYLVYKNTQSKIYPSPLNMSQAIDVIDSISMYVTEISKCLPKESKRIIYES